MWNLFSNRKAEIALEDLRSHFNDASLVHVSIDFQARYCGKDKANAANIDTAARKTADLSRKFARINLPNWWVYYKTGTPADDTFYVVEPANDDVVISKTTASAFEGSAINQQLQDKEFSALLVSGIYRSACVYQTVRDACRKGYKVFVMKDCVEGGYIANNERDELEEMRREGAVIISSDDVLRALAPAPG